MTSDNYVYLHREGEQVVYVGMGRRERCLSTAKRKPEHVQWMDAQFVEGGIAFCEVLEHGLTRDEAKRLEAALIATYRPRFNLMQNGAANAGAGPANHNSRFTEEEVNLLRELWKEHEGDISKREFHRRYMSHVGFGTALKLINNQSY